MNHLFSLALLVLTLAPQSQQLPSAFYKVPEDVRARATLIVRGTYGQGRSPCIFMPDGSRAWTLETWFQVKTVYRGQVGGKSVYLKWNGLPKNERAGVPLETGHEYLVLLRPNEESWKTIKSGKYVAAWDALDDDEVVAIVELG